jgi:hypothetical protein
VGRETDKVCTWFQGHVTGEEATSRPSSAPSDLKSGGAGPTASTFTGVSTDKNRNYPVLVGTVAGLRTLGWYLLSKEPKKTEEVIDRMGPADEFLPISFVCCSTWTCVSIGMMMIVAINWLYFVHGK